MALTIKYHGKYGDFKNEWQLLNQLMELDAIVMKWRRKQHFLIYLNYLFTVLIRIFCQFFFFFNYQQINMERTVFDNPFRSFLETLWKRELSELFTINNLLIFFTVYLHRNPYATGLQTTWSQARNWRIIRLLLS